MAAIIAFVIVSILFLIVIIHPFWGILFLWPMLFCFPHALTQDMLPLNIGFDDLYVTLLFVSVIIRRSTVGGLRFGKWGAIVLSYWIIFLISSFYGALYAHISTGPVLTFLIKGLIKESGLVMIALIVLNGIDEIDQIPKVVKWFFIGIIGLCIVSILQFFSPQMVAAFYQLAEVTAGDIVARATGTTRGPYEIGGVLGISITLSLAFLIISRGISYRPVSLICAILSLVAMVLTFSRSGWMFMVIGVFTVFVFSKRPITAVVMILAVVSIMVIFPFLTERVVQRIKWTGGVGYLDPSAMSRLIIWEEMLTNYSFGSMFTGLGKVGSFVYYRYTPHNYYLAVFFQTGIIGIIYFLILGVSLLRNTISKIKSAENTPFLMALWKGIFSVNIGIMAFSLTADTLNTDLIAKALFFFWSLLYVFDYVRSDEQYYNRFDCTSAPEPESLALYDC